MFSQAKSKALIADNSPNFIYYADKPPLLGGKPKQIRVDEFMCRYQDKGGTVFQWTETTWSDPMLIQQLNMIDYKKVHEEMRPHLEACLRDPSLLLDKLVVSFINEDVGFGVFARRRIEQYEIVLIYAGEHSYPLSLSSQYSLGTYGKEVGHIDAGSLGGMARFVQHMPTSIHDRYYHTYLNQKGKGRVRWMASSDYTLRKTDELEDPIPLEAYEDAYQAQYPYLTILPSSNFQADIATSNVGDDLYLMDGVPLLFFYSQRVIEEGEQLGFNYGHGYWKSLNKVPLLFNKKGAVSAVKAQFKESKQKAATYFSQKQYTEAYRFYHLTLGLLNQQCLIRVDRQQLFSVLQNNLAVCCREVGDYGKAIKHFSEALGLHEKTAGKNSEAYRKIFRKRLLCSLKLNANEENKQAIEFYKAGNFEKALPLFEKVLKANQEFFSDKTHLHIAAAHWSISSTCLKLNKHSQALSHARVAYEVRKGLLGSEHADTRKAFLRCDELRAYAQDTIRKESGQPALAKVSGQTFKLERDQGPNAATSLKGPVSSSSGNLPFFRGPK